MRGLDFGAPRFGPRTYHLGLSQHGEAKNASVLGLVLTIPSEYTALASIKEVSATESCR